jgi:hypothetical protein
MSTKYTTHKLTDAQLRRLSRMVNNHKGARCGQAGDALVRKGLAVYTGNLINGQPIQATELGRQALIQARAEGW